MKSASMAVLASACFFVAGLVRFGIAQEGARSKADQTPNVVNTTEDGIRILKSRYMKRCCFGTLLQVYKPGNDKSLVLVEFQTTFPAGEAWDLSVFFLEDKAFKQRIFPAFAFALAGLPDDDGFCLVRKAETGAAAMILNKEVKLVADPADAPGHIVFFRTKGDDGQEVQWPGGTGKLAMVFEVPATARNLQLVKTRKIQVAVRSLPKSLGSAPPSPTGEPKKTMAEKDVLPKFTRDLHGSNEVRIRNPNEFGATIGLRCGDAGTDFTVGSNGVASVFVPNGKYDTYFVYSHRPDELYRGDSFTLDDNGVEIKLVKVVNGNYGIRRVR